MPVATKDGDDVIDVPLGRAEIDQQRRITVHPQAECRDERSLEAVGPIGPKRRGHRPGRLADREVHRQGGDEALDLVGCGQPGQDPRLFRGKPQFDAQGGPLRHRCRGGRAAPSWMPGPPRPSWLAHYDAGSPEARAPGSSLSVRNP